MIHVSRRDFVKLAGTSAAASVFACGCDSQPSTVPNSGAIPPPKAQTKTDPASPGGLLPDRVAYVCGCKPDVHNPSGGGASALFVGNYCKNSERFLLHWDLSGLTSERKIKKAVMNLYCVEIHGTPSGRLIYAPLKSTWGDTVTYNTQPKNEAERQVSMEWPAKGHWQEVDITGIVTQWLADPTNNHGLIGYAVEVKEETCSGVFASLQMPEGLRPRLTITFPEPQ